MVYAEFGGQTECIMGNWKIVNVLVIVLGRSLPSHHMFYVSLNSSSFQTIRPKAVSRSAADILQLNEHGTNHSMEPR